MNSTILEIERKLSNSMSANETRMPNSRSSWANSSTKDNESSTPVANKSVSTDGTIRFNWSWKISVRCASMEFSSDIFHTFMFRRQQVEPQTVVRAPFYIVALTL